MASERIIGEPVAELIAFPDPSPPKGRGHLIRLWCGPSWDGKPNRYEIGEGQIWARHDEFIEEERKREIEY